MPPTFVTTGQEIVFWSHQNCCSFGHLWGEEPGSHSWLWEGSEAEGALWVQSFYFSQVSLQFWSCNVDNSVRGNKSIKTYFQPSEKIKTGLEKGVEHFSNVQAFLSEVFYINVFVETNIFLISLVQCFSLKYLSAFLPIQTSAQTSIPRNPLPNFSKPLHFTVGGLEESQRPLVSFIQHWWWAQAISSVSLESCS